MAINLSKGQRVSLDKRMSLGLVGLGWEANTRNGVDYDLDASAFLLTDEGIVRGDDDFVFYGNQEHYSGCIKSSGDDTSGGDGDDEDCEQLIINFDRIPSYVHRIAITVTIYDAQARRQSFGQIRNAYIRVCKIQYEDDQDGDEILRYDLDEDFSTETALVIGEFYRYNGEWKFNAMGDGYRGGLEGLCHKFGVNV